MNSASRAQNARLVLGTPETINDPIDQILRGSWYHGLSREARTHLPENPQFTNWYAKENLPHSDFALSLANETGFPKSLHNTQSISNKLGEPAGVSLSLNPVKSGQNFSPDQYIHRVQPQYGGPPTERVVNLMTQEGRNTLNDAYDVVANSYLNAFAGKDRLRREFFENISPNLRLLHDEPSMMLDQVMSGVQDAIGYQRIGPFNLALSDQLQSMGVS